MKKLNLFKEKITATLVLASAGAYSFAQSNLKISDFSAIENEVRKGSDSFKSIATYVLGAVLGIALIFVIWEIASNKPHAKDHLIAWLIAVGVVILAGFII